MLNSKSDLFWCVFDLFCICFASERDKHAVIHTDEKLSNTGKNRSGRASFDTVMLEGQGSRFLLARLGAEDYLEY